LGLDSPQVKINYAGFNDKNINKMVTESNDWSFSISILHQFTHKFVDVLEKSAGCCT